MSRFPPYTPRALARVKMPQPGETKSNTRGVRFSAPHCISRLMHLLVWLCN